MKRKVFLPLLLILSISVGGLNNAKASDLPVSDDIIVEDLIEECSEEPTIIEEYSEIENEELTEIIDEPIMTEDGDLAVYTINILRSDNGAVSMLPANADNKFMEGTIVTLTATPDVSSHPKYRFSHWVIDGKIIYDNPYELTIESDISLNAMFEELPTINAFGSNYDMSEADYSATVRGISFYYFAEDQYGFAIGKDYKADTALTRLNCPWKKYLDTGCEDYSPLIKKFYANWEPSTSLGSAFLGMTNCTEFKFGSKFLDNLSNVTNMSNMFDKCESLSSLLDIKNWDASNVVSTSYMFRDCKKLNSIKLPVFNNENFNSIEGMFKNCNSLTSIDNIDAVKTANVTSFDYVFDRCLSLKKLSLGFNTESSNNFVGMFRGCSSLEELALGESIITYKAQPNSYAEMFSECNSLKYIDLSEFYIKNDCVVTDMLKNCYSLQKIVTPKSSQYIGEDNSGIVLPDKDADDNPIDFYDDINFTKCSIINNLFTGRTLIKDVVTVTFDTNAPSGKTTTPVTIDDRIVGLGYKLGELPTVSCGDEYTFSGWYFITYDETDPSIELKNYVTKDTIVNTVTGTFDLFADWTPNTCIIIKSNNSAYGSVSFDNINWTDTDSRWFEDTTGRYIYAKESNENYEFIEWQWSTSEGPQTSDNKKISISDIIDNTEFTAVFDAKNKYTVKFNVSNLAYGDITFHYGRTQKNVTATEYEFTVNQGDDVYAVVSPKNPSIDRFLQWSWTTDSGSGLGNLDEIRYEITNIHNNYELEPLYQKVPHIVYKPGYSGEVDVVDTYEYDNGAQATVWGNTFEREGYRFIGWTSVINGTTYTFQPGDKISYSSKHDVELTAQWHLLHKCTVTYYSYNGTDSNPVVDRIVTCYCDDLPKNAAPADRKDIFVIADPGDPVIKPGNAYVFNGWYSSTGFTKKYDFNRQIEDSSSDITVNIYALWNQHYTVKFNGNGSTSGTMSSQKFVYNVSSRLNNCEFKKKGYRFIGWGLDKTTKKFSNYANIYNLTPENTSITLYALWEPINYTLTYSLNGGTNNSNNKKSYTVNDVIKLYDATRKGYTFSGWYLEPNYKTKVTQISAGRTGNLYLYAKWKTAKYNIKYILDGGRNNSSNPSNYTLADTIILKNPQRSGYIFKGWYSDSKFKNRVVQISKGSTGNKTFYAKWQGYTISYVLNGGTNNKKNPTIYNGGNTVDLYNASKKGYNFGGWYKDSKFKQRVKQFKPGDSGNVTLYAQWIPHTYYVKFIKNGSKTTGYMDTRKYKYGKWYLLPQLKYQRKGYTFIEWNTKADGSGTSYEDMDSFRNLTTSNNKIIKLYAIWDED